MATAIPNNKNYHKIKERAHKLWKEAGSPEGGKEKEKEFWCEAEKQVVAEDQMYNLANR